MPIKYTYTVTVECSMCGDECPDIAFDKHYAPKKEAQERAKNLGWKIEKSNAYCPECAKKLDEFF